MLLIARLVHRETSSFGAPAIAAGLLAACYPFSGTSLDLGRVDALFTFFLLGGVAVAYSETLRSPRRWYVFAASGCLIGLAGLSKVPSAAALVTLAVVLYLVATARGGVLAYLGGLVITIVAVVFLLRVQSGPWPTWYLWDLPSAHDVEEKFLGRMWFGDLTPRMTLPLLLGPVFVLAHALRRNRRPVLFYGLVMPALLGVSWASRSNAGAALNVLIPAFSVLAILLGLGVHATLRQIGGESVRARAFQAYVLAVCIAQFLLLAYNPRLVVPYRSEQWAAERLAARVLALPGEIFAPGLAGYLLGSEKADQPYPSALGELTGAYGGPRNPEGVRWFAALREALAQRR
jgi:hypothetical protein